MTPDIFSEHRCILGEGPLWDHRHQRLWWLDIKGKELFCKDQHERKWDLPRMVSALACTNSSNLLLATDDGLYSFDTETEQHQPLLALEQEYPDNRCNDGKTDRAGRFWFGTMDNLERNVSGALYCYDGSVARKVLKDIQISNTLCWAPDNQTMYFADSGQQVIWAL